ncbi:DoxX family protein [Kocuria sp.]|uniref:DoxX family protein n=1 Tax=Kocuria sp. TaxID=1871328 RepID=UPI0026DB846B|nr:DoxX family protein [Kocuria sp.]MDO4918623.1 DoxX family protein [Kocuria sp.]
MTSKTAMTDFRLPSEHSAPAAPATSAGAVTEHHRTHHATHAVSLGLLILRVVLGITFVMHGWQKVSEWGIAGTTDSFEGMGVPAPAASAVFAAVVELVGGIALILGVLTRIVGLLLALDMLGALVLVHASSGFFASGGGIELVLVLGAAALALAFTGPGRYAVARVLPATGAGRLLS